jgi:chromate transporter
MIYWQLFLAFFRIGIFGYGGGPTMIPLLISECVKKYNWVTAEEFADYYALGNALPGPIATKMAAYVGYRVKGWTGAIVANCAMVLPVVIGMVGLLQFVYILKESTSEQGMIQAIQPVIGMMTAVLTYEFLSKGWKEAEKKSGVIAMLVLTLAVLLWLEIHPGILVGLTLLASFLYTTWSLGRAKKRSGKQEGGTLEL